MDSRAKFGDLPFRLPRTLPKAVGKEGMRSLLGFLLPADEYEELARSVVEVERMLASLLTKIDTERRMAEC